MALHLYHDLLAGEQGGGVDLGDRRRRQWFAVERGEHILQAGTEVGLDDTAHDVERLGRNLVATLLELAHQLGGE